MVYANMLFANYICEHCINNTVLPAVWAHTDFLAVVWRYLAFA